MSQHSVIKNNLESNHKVHSHRPTGNSSLSLSLTILIAWTIVIGLLLSLLTCQPNSSEPFFVQEILQVRSNI